MYSIESEVNTSNFRKGNIAGVFAGTAMEDRRGGAQVPLSETKYSNSENGSRQMS